ncbi:hypothetical protein CROQUDRAFT_409716 [Cronartium quercuum f. sp. fusiforme G11]|uniref:Uncharacterized protein n=1 Tax=Cronartium quercuum f. sp. fusiforme G11 TaxID=708437 RepID=A0A9P6TDI0_9BASI|nr:hypothetical protein CROQUDRAFT_409716 [Cronartium quercuum f. sp. fusiforme G11]
MVECALYLPFSPSLLHLLSPSCAPPSASGSLPSIDLDFPAAFKILSLGHFALCSSNKKPTLSTSQMVSTARRDRYWP